jgi:hypothetical protein
LFYFFSVTIVVELKTIDQGILVRNDDEKGKVNL